MLIFVRGQYQLKVHDNARLNNHIGYLSKIYNKADYRIKTQPVCFESSSDLLTNPVSRKPIKNKIDLRNELEIPKNHKVIMITMGGIPTQYGFFDKFELYKDITFIIP